MGQTPQREADEQLAAAIDRASVAYFGHSGRVVTEYVVVVARQGWDADGDPVSSVETLHPDGDLPYHRALGLVEYAATVYRTRIAGGAA